MARFNIFSPGNAVRSFVSAPANVAILLSGCALMFLWPYYQRSFYRVTLFHRLGELSEPCYAAFLVLTAVAWAVAALWHNRLETIQRNHPHAVLGAALVSPIATLYLAGIVTPGTPVGTGTALAVTAALLYAACLFAVTAAGIACLMRCVYGSSLFMGTIVLIASNLAGRLVAPSSSLSSISTFAMPVFGIMAAGVCAFFAQRLQVKAKATEGGNYQPFGDAPYKGIWLAPLVAYLLLSTLHAITFLNDDTIEVHVVGATISPAPFPPSAMQRSPSSPYCSSQHRPSPFAQRFPLPKRRRFGLPRLA